MIKFNLITGFLGSGKTTLLNHLLAELSKTIRIAVIQNEFAPTGIDGKELKLSGDDFQLVEINNGSVFCVCQLNNFEQTLQKLINEYKPEVVFLEASGLADPISIAELLQVSSLENKITLDSSICLVDAVNFHKGLNSLVRFKHQIMIADKIILNKIDLRTKAINSIIDEIESINPYADILPCSYAKVSWKQLSNNFTYKGKAAKKYSGIESKGRPSEMKAYVLRLHDKISIKGLEQFVMALQNQCVRIKGFVNLNNGSAVLLQSVFEQFKTKPIKDYIGPTEIIVFGKNIELGALRKLYKNIAIESN